MNIFFALGAGFATAGLSYTLINFLENKAKNVTKYTAKYAYLFKISKPVLDVDNKFLEGNSDFYFHKSGLFTFARHNNLDKDRFFLYDNVENIKEIDLESEIGILSRVIYSEASPGRKFIVCKVAVVNVIKNRFYSPIYKQYKYKNLIDVIKAKNWNKDKQKWTYQFDGASPTNFKFNRDIKRLPSSEKQDFLYCIQSALIAYYTK